MKGACTECHAAKSKCVYSHLPQNIVNCDRCLRLKKKCVPHVSRQGKRKKTVTQFPESFEKMQQLLESGCNRVNNTSQESHSTCSRMSPIHPGLHADAFKNFMNCDSVHSGSHRSSFCNGMHKSTFISCSNDDLTNIQDTFLNSCKQFHAPASANNGHLMHNKFGAHVCKRFQGTNFAGSDKPDCSEMSQSPAMLHFLHNRIDLEGGSACAHSITNDDAKCKQFDKIACDHEKAHVHSIPTPLNSHFCTKLLTENCSNNDSLNDLIVCGLSKSPNIVSANKETSNLKRTFCKSHIPSNDANHEEYHHEEHHNEACTNRNAHLLPHLKAMNKNIAPNNAQEGDHIVFNKVPYLGCAHENLLAIKRATCLTSAASDHSAQNQSLNTANAHVKQNSSKIKNLLHVHPCSKRNNEFSAEHDSSNDPNCSGRPCSGECSTPLGTIVSFTFDACINICKRKQILPQNHFGLQCQISQWISMAFSRRSFGLLSAASSFADKSGIDMEKIFNEIISEGKITKETENSAKKSSCSNDLKGKNCTRKRSKCIISMISESLAYQTVPIQEQLMLIPFLPSTFLSLMKLCSSFTCQRDVMQDRWILIRETDHGITHWYCSPPFERNVLSWNHIIQIFDDNLVDLNSLIYLHDTFKRILYCSALQISMNYVERIHSCPVYTPRVKLRLLEKYWSKEKSKDEMTPITREMIQERHLGDVETVEKDLIFILFPTMNKITYYWEFFDQYSNKSENQLCQDVMSEKQSLTEQLTDSNLLIPPPLDSIIENEDCIVFDDYFDGKDFDQLIQLLID